MDLPLRRVASRDPDLQSRTVSRGMPVRRLISQSLRPSAMRRITVSNSFFDLVTNGAPAARTAIAKSRKGVRHSILFSAALGSGRAGVVELAYTPVLGAG